MRKQILAIAITLLISGTPEMVPAQKAVPDKTQRRIIGGIDFDRMERDIEIMENILKQLLASTEGLPGWGTSENSSGFYLEETRF